MFFKNFIFKRDIFKIGIYLKIIRKVLIYQHPQLDETDKSGAFIYFNRPLSMGFFTGNIGEYVLMSKINERKIKNENIFKKIFNTVFSVFGN